MQQPFTRGEDVIVYLDANDCPIPVVTKCKLTVAQLKAAYGEATVYLSNKNLQTFRRRMRGAIVWLPSMGIIAAVIESNGRSAGVRTLHPRNRKDEEHVLNDITTIEGHYLQLVTDGSGADPLPIDYTYRAREAGVTLVDMNGCIKMNVQGPDVLVTPKTPPKSVVSTATMSKAKASKAMKRQIRELGQENPDTVLNTEPLPKRPKLNEVGVVYVYRHCGDYRFVERHYDERRKKLMPVVSIPIGECKRTSDRYVCLFEW
jgi:hypothetical protein